MQIFIDNSDGLGALDYTGCIQFGKSAGLTRRLNEATTLSLSMIPSALSLRVPPANAYVRAMDSQGSLLFTGYVIDAAIDQTAGVCANGSISTVRVEAVSDEVVLDSEVNLISTTLLAETAGAAWESLSAASTTTGISISVAENVGSPSRLRVVAGERWSSLARSLGDQARTSHVVLSSRISVVPIGNAVHTVSSQDAGLRLLPGSLNDLRWVADDVTVCGKEEPDAYITELFQGDGVTVDFSLSQKPFDPPISQRVSVEDTFQGNTLNAALWRVSDPDAHLSLTANGLTCGGGTGRDAESVVAGVQQVELGGVITLEGGGVMLEAGSVGSILGFYVGAVNTQNCLAGYGVNTSSGVTTVSPMVNGAAIGSSFTPSAGASYLYRVRLYSPESERVRQMYFYESAGVTGSIGGSTVTSAGMIEFEVQEVTSGVPGAASVLYCGAIASVPPVATLGLIESGALSCSIRSVTCVQSLPVWATVGALGNAVPYFAGASTAGGTCTITSEGKLEFYPANIPSSGTLISVSYRSGRRAVARRSTGAGAAQPTGSASSWVGSVTTPAPLSSVDCDNAAAALLAMASQPSSRLQGTYELLQREGGQDIWPGDVLNIEDPVTGVAYWAIVRSVAILLVTGSPGFLQYKVVFANDWAENLSIKTSEEVPEDTVVPLTPATSNTALLSLSALSAQSISGSAITVSTGVSAPTNGGFEVRRRDEAFGEGTDSDLVLRSAASTITLPRSSAVEHFYIRMYDGSQPPNYSAHSAALFINVPL